MPDEGEDERRKTDGASALILPPLADPVASANAREATATDPEKFAKAKAIAQQLALPVPTVERNFDLLDSERKVRDMQARMLADPFYADRMRDPDFAKLSQGDELSLAGVAKAVALLPWKVTQMIAAGAHSLGGGLYGYAAAPFDLASEYVAKPLLTLGGRTYDPASDPFGAAGVFLRRQSKAAGEYAKRVADVPEDAGEVHRAVAAGFQSLGANLPPMVAALYTGNLPLALYTMAASTGGQSYTKGREAGLTPLAGVQYGFTDAAIEYITERGPLFALVGAMKVGTPFIRSLMQNQLREQFGEQLATVGQDFNEWATLRPDAPFSQYLAERPNAALQTAIATLVASGGQVAILHAVQSDAMRQEAKANAEANTLRELLANAGASLLRERNPDTFTQFVAAAAERGPVDAVYVDAATFMQEVQKAGLDMAKMPETQAALQDAVATKSDVRIPLSEFASAVPGTTMEQSIIPHLKTDPDGATLQETKDKAWVEDTMAKTQRILDAHDFTDKWKASAAAVKNELLAQLTQANRFTRDVNDAYASFMAAFYSTQAHRIGVTPEQMYVKYPLQIRAQSIAGVNVLSQPVSVRPRQPEAVSIRGTHFSNVAGLSALAGSMSGTGIRGAERGRLSKATDSRIRQRVYFYEGDDPTPERGLGAHRYQAELQNLYPFDTDPRGILARIAGIKDMGERHNAMESAVIDEGFDGYAAEGIAVVLGADVPVTGEQPVTVNIGLKVGETGSITPDEAFAALRAAGVSVTRSEVKQSGTEPTLVAHLSRPLTDAEAHAVAVATKQEAIAQQARGAGKLHGPQAAKWGEFNPEFFLTLDATYNQDSVPRGWYYSELAAQIDKLEVPAEGWTAAEWKAKLVEPEYVKTVQLRDEKNRPMTDLAGPVVKKVTVQARALLPGTKLMEIEATGITDWLELGASPITKAAVQTFLRNHGVQVETTILSGDTTEEPEFSISDAKTEEPDPQYMRERAKESEEYKDAVVEAQRENGGRFLSHDELNAILDRQIEKEVSYYYDDTDSPSSALATLTYADTSYEFVVEYAYGEVSIYFPGQDKYIIQGSNARRVDAEHEIRHYAAEYLDAYSREGEAQYSEFQLPGAEDDSYLELLLTLPGLVLFSGPHYDAFNNLLVHARANMRIVNGERVLFIEEIQSDWAQQGREKGFVQQRVVDTTGWTARPPGGGRRLWEVSDAAGAFVRNVPAATEAEAVATASLGGIMARAPFITKTDAWVALMWKRLIRYAAENDYDRIAWTRGDQQVKRWTNALRQRVDYIEWVKTPEGVQLLGFVGSPSRTTSADIVQHVELDGTVTYVVVDAQGRDFRTGIPTRAEAVEQLHNMPEHRRRHTTLTPNNVRKVVDTTYKEDQLSDAIGKTMGRKILSDPAQTGTIEGPEITIDDIGMSQFYGDAAGLKGDGNAAIAAKVANEVLKKFGGGKVEATDAGTENVFDYAGPELTYYDVLRLQFGGVLDGGAQLVAGFTAHGMQQGSVFSQALEAAASTRGSGAADAIRFASAAGGKLTRKPTQPGFVIPPDLKAKALSGFPLFQDQRGQVSFAADITKTPSVITLLENADLSTFLHESGHFFLEVMNDMAAQPDAPAEVVADLNAVLKWFGIAGATPIEVWRSMSMEQRRPYHEQWARGVEAYMFEGKSPSLEMNTLFGRFRAWLVNVYQQLTKLNVTLTPEVRQVMSHLIATNDEIMRAEDARSFAPMFQTKPPGMSDADWVEYQKLPGDATQNAIDQLQTRSLRDMQYASRAKADVLKRLQRQASDKRSGVRAEVQGEVSAEPIYQVMHFLRTGKMTTPEGEEIQVATFRLDTNALAEAYPPTALANPDLSRLNGMTRNGGLHPNLVAQMFGFGSGDELVRKLVDAEPFRQKVDGLTDQRMLERYGDLADPNNMEKAANAAVHNDVRGRFVATELRMLDKAVGKRGVLIAAAKDYATTLIAGKKVRSIHPHVYDAAEANAGKNAERALLAGDTALAATEKRNQLVNLYAAKAAHAALDEVEKGVAKMKRIGESGTLDPSYREQIAALLERFDLRKVSGVEAKRRTSLLQWIEKQREQNLEPVIDPMLENEALRKPYQDLTLEEFRGLVDSMRNIEHLGRLKHRLLTAADQRAFDVIVAEAAGSINLNSVRTIASKLERDKTWLGRARKGAKEAFVMHLKLSTMAREMDGWIDGGMLQRLVVHTMNASGAREATLHEQATIALSQLMKPIFATGKLTKKTFIPEIDDSLSREGRIMVALNMGNEGNLQRLLDGDHWTPAQAQAVLDTLTKPEMDFVQSVWDFVGSYRAAVGEQQKRLTGLEPDWVEPRQVVTRHGVYAGGYLPAKYDTARSTRSMSDEAAAGLIDAWRAKRGAAQTRASFTKERADKVVDRPLLKDFSVITRHITEVTHRLAWQDWVVDTSRLLRAAPIDAAIREHYGPEVLESMRDTVEDIARGPIPAQNVMESAANYVRTGSVIAGLGWNLTTGILQGFGLTQSFARIGPKWIGRGLAEWLGDAAHMENTAKRIYEKSEMMRLRGKTMQREISEILDLVENRSSAVKVSYFYLIQKIQLVADIPTWLGQYAKAVEGGADETGAVAQADQAVKDAQGGGQLHDQAAVMRGGAFLKLFTTFATFFNSTFNVGREVVGRTDFKSPMSVAMLGVDFLMLVSVPAALSTLLRWALSDDDDEDKLVRTLIADQISYLFGTVIGLREVAGGARVALDLPGDYAGPASLRLFSELTKLGKQAAQGEIDEPFAKAALNTGGILFHLPTGQITKTVDGIVALTDGRTDNPGVLVGGSSKK